MSVHSSLLFSDVAATEFNGRDYAYIKECGKYNNYLNQNNMQNNKQGQLLSAFNSFAFHNTTQILLASLTSP